MDEQTTTQQPDLSALTSQIQQLATENAQLKSELAKLKPLQGEVETYKTNFSQTNAQLEQLKQQYQTTQAEYEKTRNQFMEISTAHTTAQQELNLLRIIGSKPEYQALLPVANSILRDPDPTKQEEIVANMAALVGASRQQAVKEIQAGSVPVVNRTPQVIETTPDPNLLWFTVQNERDPGKRNAALSLLQQQLKQETSNVAR